jgi:predicted peptidase
MAFQSVGASARPLPTGKVHSCTNPLYAQNTCITAYYSDNGDGNDKVTSIVVSYDHVSGSTKQCGKYGVKNSAGTYLFGPTGTTYCYVAGKGGTHTWYPTITYPHGYTFCAVFTSTTQSACASVP